MFLADALDTSSALATLGVPGLVVIIIALASVIVWQNKKIDKIQEQRIVDAKDLGNKITEPLANIASVNEQNGKFIQQIYDLVRFNGKRDN